MLITNFQVKILPIKFQIAFYWDTHCWIFSIFNDSFVYLLQALPHWPPQSALQLLHKRPSFIHSLHLQLAFALLLTLLRPPWLVLQFLLRKAPRNQLSYQSPYTSASTRLHTVNNRHRWAKYKGVWGCKYNHRKLWLQIKRHTSKKYLLSFCSEFRIYG